jgi:acyl transferase domain-containing protein
MEVAVGLFPGQGGYRAGCLDGLLTEREARNALEHIDDITREMLGRSLLDKFSGTGSHGSDDLFAADPEMLQIAIFAVSVALFETLRARGAQLAVLLGHSLGEIAALVCSGALTLAEGTRILCHRVMVLREYDTSGGTMLALACDRARAEGIVALLPASGTTIAVENGVTQTVLSGTADALRRVELIAGAIGLSATALRSPHPFHNAQLQPARQELLTRIRGHRSHGLTIPVFSPILGRYYREHDDLGELLASHLVSPVEFRQAISRAHRAGARIWVEIGAGRALTNLVRSAHPDATVFTPLWGPDTEIAATAAFLAGGGNSVSPAATADVRSVTTTWNQSPASEFPSPGLVEPMAEPAVVPVAKPVVEHSVEPVASPVLDETSAAGPGNSTGELSRTHIEQRVRALYATALEYPHEVFEHHAELEADLGVDSVKQTELMARLGEVFTLGPRPEGLRVADYRTFGQVVDFVCESLLAGSAA